MGLSSASSASRSARLVGGAVGAVVAASILCVGQPAFADGHRQPAEHRSGPHAGKHEDGNTERARAADCPARGDRDPRNAKAAEQRALAAQRQAAQRQSAQRQAAQRQAARERAAKQAGQAARQKAAEQKAAEQKAAKQKTAAHQITERAAQLRAAQLQAAKPRPAAPASNVAQQPASRPYPPQLVGATLPVSAVDAASAVLQAAGSAPISGTDPQQGPGLSTSPKAAAPAPTKATQPAKSKNEKAKPATGSRPVAQDPILAIPTMIVSAGLSVGVAPEILLALVLFSGLGLVVVGTYRRKVGRSS